MTKEAIEALEAARAHILDAYRIWQADDVSAVPPPKSGAGSVIAKIDAVLSSPIAGDGKVEWESPEEWEIEQRYFHAVGRDDVPVDVQQLVAKLWAMYCHAAAPSSPGKDGGQEVEAVAVLGYVREAGLRSLAERNHTSVYPLPDEERGYTIPVYTQPASTALVERLTESKEDSNDR